MALANGAWTDADFNWYRHIINLYLENKTFWVIAYMKYRQAATAAGTQIYGTSILLTIYNYLDSLDTSKSSIYVWISYGTISSSFLDWIIM